MNWNCSMFQTTLPASVLICSSFIGAIKPFCCSSKSRLSPNGRRTVWTGYRTAPEMRLDQHHGDGRQALGGWVEHAGKRAQGEARAGERDLRGNISQGLQSSRGDRSADRHRHRDRRRMRDRQTARGPGFIQTRAGRRRRRGG
jgi:hypothetical protein